jgi:hypothetical protein
MRRVVVWSLDAILSGFGPSFVFEGEGAALHARRTFTNTGGRSGTWTFRCTEPFYLSDSDRLAKSEPARSLELSPPPASAPASANLPKKTEEHASIPGFVWDHNQNRYIPVRNAQKPALQPQAEPKMTQPVAPQPTQAPPTYETQHARELIRTLQPGESFVLHVGLSGKPPVSGGTLFGNGPGLRHEEALFAKDAAVRQRGRLTGAPNMLLAEKKPVASPSGLNVEGAALPPPAQAATIQQFEIKGAAALPSIAPPKKGSPKRGEVRPQKT